MNCLLPCVDVNQVLYEPAGDCWVICCQFIVDGKMFIFALETTDDATAFGAFRNGVEG